MLFEFLYSTKQRVWTHTDLSSKTESKIYTGMDRLKAIYFNVNKMKWEKMTLKVTSCIFQPGPYFPSFGVLRTNGDTFLGIGRVLSGIASAGNRNMGFNVILRGNSTLHSTSTKSLFLPLTVSDC